MASLSFSPLIMAQDVRALRSDVRAFLRIEMEESSLADRARSWSARDPEFSRKLGARGWIGMTWPARYGGHDQSTLERYIVVEELLAAGAPVGAHWIADRQSGPLLLRFGTEEQRARLLPRMALGRTFFCIGLSEPGAGSDLAALRTRATKVDGGWRVNGSKIWCTNADIAHFMIALVRTREQTDDRREGLSQLIIDLHDPGVEVRPIADLTGIKHFNEVFFQDLFVADFMLVGTEGEGWKQVTAELALERSGPERYLSSYCLLEALADSVTARSDQEINAALGAHLSQLWVLRQMSMSVAGQLADGRDPSVEAAIVKDLGTEFEQQLTYQLQGLVEPSILNQVDPQLIAALEYLLQVSPGFSVRGGSREILRSVIARGLGLR